MRPDRLDKPVGIWLWSLYGPFKRLAMLFFVKLVGGDTDRSRDYEYTDWVQVERLAGEFARLLKPGS